MTKPKIQNILVPIDFSKLSIRAIDAAKNLAQRFGATVHLVYVHEFYDPIGFTALPAAVPVPMPGWSVAAAEKIANERRQELRGLAARFGLSARNCYFREGAPVFDEICRLAREIRADLIVIPTHGRTGLKHTFLGSTAERVVQHSPCPIFVQRQAPGKIDKILVPVDFSRCSLEALEYAIALADRTASKIIVLHALHLGYAFTADGYAMYDLSSLTEAARKGAEGEMRAFVRKAKFGGVKFEATVQVGPPVSEICRLAEAKDVDLIITATHGYTGLKHLLMGSVAEQTVRYAHRSVLVVPSHPAERLKRITTKKRSRPVGQRKSPRKALTQISARREQLTKRFRKVARRPFPERRKTNKFRESHQF